MTQEELDTLLNGGGDIDNIDPDVNSNDSELTDEFADIVNEVASDDNDSDGGEEIYPPPADDKHKVVAQLDEVTKESEEKASQVLEIISEISEEVGDLTQKLSDVKEFLVKEKEIFEKLHSKFPHIKTFEAQIREIEDKIEEIDEVLEKSEEMDTKLFTALEIMQYQDIHRQKIERVINIMRALIKYMNKLFEGKVADEERVKSANYIHGDTEEALSEDEIEKLLQEFGG